MRCTSPPCSRVCMDVPPCVKPRLPRTVPYGRVECPRPEAHHLPPSLRCALATASRHPAICARDAAQRGHALKRGTSPSLSRGCATRWAGPSATLIGGPAGAGAARAAPMCMRCRSRQERRGCTSPPASPPCTPSCAGHGLGRSRWRPMCRCGGAVSNPGQDLISARGEAHEPWVPALGAGLLIERPRWRRPCTFSSGSPYSTSAPAHSA
jgi:hypothetical protein